MRLAAVLILAGCQMSGEPAAPVPVPARRPPPAPADASPPVDAMRPATPPAVECMADERRWGTTCCHSEGEPGFHHWMSCRGPQLGKVCHKRGDCDLDCECDRALVHHDGQTGATGRCAGPPPSGQWTCELDEAGKVSSLIID